MKRIKSTAWIVGAILTAVLISSRDSREHAEAASRGEVEPAPAAG